MKFELYSVPSGRNVVISAPVVKNVRPASDSTQPTTTLAAGKRKRIEYPVDGKQVWRTVTVYNADGSHPAAEDLLLELRADHRDRPDRSSGGVAEATPPPSKRFCASRSSNSSQPVVRAKSRVW